MARYRLHEHSIKQTAGDIHEEIYSNNVALYNKSVDYSSQGSHTGQLVFCNWLADDSTTE